MKNNKKPIMFDYNKPIEADKIEVISFEDNGKAKITKFIYNSRYYTHKYTYGNFYGYTFIYEYDNDSQQKNHLHQLGGRLIYSSTLEVDCTPFGKYLEYSLMKTQALKKSINIIQNNAHKNHISNIPNGLSYNDFYSAFLEAFSKDHPNSTAPKDTIISMFYDDYCNNNHIPSY